MSCNCVLLSRGLGLVLLAASGLLAQDPAFDTIPFEKWLTERDQTHFLWAAKTTGGHLTNLQRLGATVEVTVDGKELANRRGQGELAVFIQFSDSDHRVYRTHGSIDLKNATEEAAKSNIVYSQPALVMPGEYRIDIAILDTNNGEHATLTRSLRVAPLKNDSLPDSMRDLPPVEFIAPSDPPDAWYQPLLTGRLHLHIERDKPGRIEILANASPSSIGPRFRSGELNSRILTELIPGLKVLSQIELSQGDLGVSMMDVTRRQVLFSQTGLGAMTNSLDWEKLRPALLQADPNKIDVRELSDSSQNPQFFVREVRKRVAADAALVILSAPIAFASHDDRRPIEVEDKPQAKVYYFRFHPLPVHRPVEEFPRRGAGRRRGGAGLQGAGMLAQEPPDSLAGLLKPLQPRIYDIYTPDQFRKALADLMKELGSR